MSGIGSDVDFICLGAGIGGLTAALLAHDRGLSVVVLEKSDQIGGVAAYSSGQTYAPASHFPEQAGIADSYPVLRAALAAAVSAAGTAITTDMIIFRPGR